MAELLDQVRLADLNQINALDDFDADMVITGDVDLPGSKYVRHNQVGSRGWGRISHINADNLIRDS
jgi:hypothetical protein